MKSTKIFIAFTFLLAFALQVSAQEKMPKIVWKNLQEKYEKFEDIKPIIENQSDNSIFLAKIYPLWSARLIGFNEQTQKWESKGGAIKLCYTVEDALVPIEIKSQESRSVSVSQETISAYQEQENSELIFKKYKLILSYSLVTWTREQKPERIYKTISPEFEVSGGE